MNKQLLCKCSSILFALLSTTAIFAKSLQVDGVTVTTENSKNVLGDGSVAYDASSQTLTIKSFVFSDLKAPLIEVSSGNSDISLDESVPFVLNLNSTGGYLSFKELVDTVIGGQTVKFCVNDTIIKYNGDVVVEGGGSLTLAGSVSCSKFTVRDFSSVDVKRRLNAQSLEVDNAYLIVGTDFSNEKGDVVLVINNDMKECVLKGVTSNATLYDTTIYETIKVRKNLGTTITDNGSFISLRPHYVYEYQKVGKDIHGWYQFNSAGFQRVRTIEFAPKAYPIWVNGVEVDRYNFNDVLKDGSVRYEPRTKTLSVSSEVEIKYEGYLTVKDKDGQYSWLTPESANSGGLTINEPQKPSYSSTEEWFDEETSVQIIGGGDFFEITESGEYTFPALLNGKIISDVDKHELTFDNVVLDSIHGLVIRGGSDLTIKLVGENYLLIDQPGDLTIYRMGHVRFSGDGYLKANQIYFVKSDSLSIEGGCDIELQKLTGGGVLSIDNSSVSLLGDSIGTMWGFYELNLNNCNVATPSSIFYNSINEDDYDSEGEYLFTYQYGYLSTAPNMSPIRGEVKIVPTPSSKVNDCYESPLIWNLNAPKFDLLGRPVYDGYKGVYIQGGRKFRMLDK